MQRIKITNQTKIKNEMRKDKLIKLISRISVEDFNAEDYWNDAEQLRFVAIGFNFTFEEIDKIKKEFENKFAKVIGLELDILNQKLTVRFN